MLNYKQFFLLSLAKNCLIFQFHDIYSRNQDLSIASNLTNLYFYKLDIYNVIFFLNFIVIFPLNI